MRHPLGLIIHHVGQVWIVSGLLRLFVRSYARFFADTLNEEASQGVPDGSLSTWLRWMGRCKLQGRQLLARLARGG